MEAPSQFRLISNFPSRIRIKAVCTLFWISAFSSCSSNEMVRRPNRRYWRLSSVGRRLGTMCRNSGNVDRESLFITAVCLRGQLDHCVKWNFQVRDFLLGIVLEVGIDRAQHRLMPDYQDVLLPLEFHNDRLEAQYQVLVGFAARVAIVKFIMVTCGKIIRMLVL